MKLFAGWAVSAAFFVAATAANAQAPRYQATSDVEAPYAGGPPPAPGSYGPPPAYGYLLAGYSNRNNITTPRKKDGRIPYEY